MVQNFTPLWGSATDTPDMIGLVKSPQIASAFGNKVDADGGQSINQSIQSGALDALSTLDGVSVTDVLAASSRAQVSSVMQFRALKTAPVAVTLTSWDGTAQTRGAAGIFLLASDGLVADGGVVIATAGAGTYRRVFQGGVDPAWYGAIGDGTSHPASTMFATLADLQTVFPKAYSLSQEMDWLAIQAASLSGYGVSGPKRAYMMCNSAVASDDKPLVWIPGTTFGSFGGSTFDFTALETAADSQDFVTNGTFSDTSGAGWSNATIYPAMQITDATFTTGAAIFTDPAAHGAWTGTVSGGVMTVTGFSGSPALAVGSVVYDIDNTLASGTTITKLLTGTGGDGTYQISDGAASITTAVAMSNSTGHYGQFGQKLTLPAGNYTLDVKYEVTLGASYANGNGQPGNVGVSFSANGPGSGDNPWNNYVFKDTGWADPAVEGEISFAFNVAEAGSAWLTISVSGYINVRVTSVSVKALRWNCAVLSTRDGALEHYSNNVLIEGLTILGPTGNAGLTGLFYNSFQNTDGTIHNFKDLSIQGFGVGIDWRNGAYLAEYWNCSVTSSALYAVQFLAGSVNAGENFRWYGGSLGNSTGIVFNPGGAEITFYGTSLDYSDQIVIQNTGRIEMHGVHCEMWGPQTENKPLFHCTGSGYLGWFGGMILLAGNSATYKTPPVWMEQNLSQICFYGTQLYNLTSADGRAAYGAGSIKTFNMLNTGNPNIGTFINGTSDRLGLSGKFIPQSKSVLCRDGIGLAGGLYSDNADAVSQWVSDGASVAMSTAYTVNGNPAALAVTTQGNSRNDRVVLCIPIDRYQSGFFNIQCLFPYDLTQTGKVLSTNSQSAAYSDDVFPLYARAFYVSIVGYDSFGRPNFGARDLFAGEADFRIPKQGCTQWMEAGFACAYLGLPSAGTGENDISLAGAGGAPSFATHIAIVLDSESLPATTYYIGEFGGSVF